MSKHSPLLCHGRSRQCGIRRTFSPPRLSYPLCSVRPSLHRLLGIQQLHFRCIPPSLWPQNVRLDLHSGPHARQSHSFAREPPLSGVNGGRLIAACRRSGCHRLCPLPEVLQLVPAGFNGGDVAPDELEIRLELQAKGHHQAGQWGREVSTSKGRWFQASHVGQGRIPDCRSHVYCQSDDGT